MAIMNSKKKKAKNGKNGFFKEVPHAILNEFFQ